MSDILLLPGDPFFNEILHSAPPPDLKGNNETNNKTIVIGADGMPRGINSRKELNEYLLGGEYDLVMMDDDFNEDLEDDDLEDDNYSLSFYF